MREKSAFVDAIRSSNDFYPVEAPDFHSNAFVTGGLRGLYHMIDNDIEPPISDIGQHTDSNGHFVPGDKCVLGLRYKIIKILDAKGQSAVLVEAKDLFCGDKVVVIKVLHTRFYQLGKQESHVLRKLAVADPFNYSHTLRLLTTLTVDTHYCLVFEPMLPDPLNQVFSCVPHSKKLADIRRVGLRLLSSISFLHQQNIIHTDLKPENILLKQANNLDSVHIVDFGNAINFVHSEVSLYYQDFELQTPLYRAPEVMFGIPFGPEIDIWSLGCILAELYLGKHLFLGLTSDDIVKQMYELLGSFPKHLFRRGKYYQSFKKYTGENDQSKCILKLKGYMQCSDYDFADLIAGMLRYNPEERLTASQAARHPFFASCLPLGFLFPDSKGGCSYSSVALKENSYQYAPYIAPSIKRQPLSPLDLLEQGTSERSNVNTMLLKPQPKVARIRGYKHGMFSDEDGTNSQSRGSYSQKISGHARQESYCDESVSSQQGSSSLSDVSVVRNLINHRNTSKYSENVKDRITSLLLAIRDEQSVVEDDLNRRNDDRYSDNRRRSLNKNYISTNVLRPCPKYGEVDFSVMNTNMAEDSRSIDRKTSSVYKEKDEGRWETEDFSCTNVLGPCPKYGKIDLTSRNTNMAENRSTERLTSSMHEEKDEGSWDVIENGTLVHDVNDGEKHVKLSLTSGRKVNSKKVPMKQQRTATESSCHECIEGSNVENRNFYSEDIEQGCSSVKMKMSQRLNDDEKQHRYSSESSENLHAVCNKSPYTVHPKLDGREMGRMGSNKKFLTRPTAVHPIHTDTSNNNMLQYKQNNNQIESQHSNCLASSREIEDPHQLINGRNETTHGPKISKEQTSDSTPHHRYQKMNNRKRGSNISLSDEDEYLELLSPPSSVKTKRKNSPQVEGWSTNRLKTCEKNDHLEDVYKKQMFMRRKSSPLEIKARNSDFDRHTGSQNKYSDYKSSDMLKLEPVCESEIEQANLLEKHDLKLSARKSSSSYSENISGLTPIRKFSPVISKNTVSPEIIYKDERRKDLSSNNKKSGSRNSLKYQYHKQNNPMQTELKQNPSQIGCYRNRRDNVQCQSKELNYEDNHDVEDTDDDSIEEVRSDLNSEMSRHGEFSFRSTPSTEKKRVNSNVGIANRIAQINKKRKIIAKKSLLFPSNKSDEQSMNKDESEYYSERKRPRASNDPESSNFDERNSNNFTNEKCSMNRRSNYRQLYHTENRKASTVVDKDEDHIDFVRKSSKSDVHQFAWKSQKDIKHDENSSNLISQANNDQESQMKRKDVRYQKKQENAETARNKLKRHQIRKNDTFTIDFESPVH